MASIVDIAEELKNHDREWLLFEVTQVAENNLAVKGRLLYHCKGRDDIHRVATKHRGKDLKIAFAGDPQPPGTVVVL